MQTNSMHKKWAKKNENKLAMLIMWRVEPFTWQSLKPNLHISPFSSSFLGISLFLYCNLSHFFQLQPLSSVNLHDHKFPVIKLHSLCSSFFFSQFPQLMITCSSSLCGMMIFEAIEEGKRERKVKRKLCSGHWFNPFCGILPSLIWLGSHTHVNVMLTQAPNQKCQ